MTVSTLQTLATLIDYALIGVFFSSVLFLVVYTTIAKWWQHPIGKALVVVDTGLAMTTAPGTFRRLFDVHQTGTGYLVYVTISLGLVLVGLNWRTYILIRDQIRGSSVVPSRIRLRKQDDDDRHEEERDDVTAGEVPY